MKVIFRADGNAQTGLGHIMRSCAVMQILQPHYNCEIWTRNPAHIPVNDFAQLPAVKELPNSDIMKEAEVIAESVSENDTTVVLDGYQFLTEYQSIIKRSNIKLVCIDDIFQYHFLADVVINHAGGVDEQSYSCESYTQLLLGPKYALVKPLFFHRLHRDLSSHKILISLGAADPNNDTNKVLEKLVSLNLFTEMHIVIGAANQIFSTLKTKYSENKACIFHNNLSAQSIFTLMKLCPYAVLTPSTICYEYMSLGGVVYLYQIAANQQHIKKFFVNNKLAYDFEELNNVSYNDMEYSIQQQTILFDHKSQERILEVFANLSKKNKMRVTAT